jgi:hypothetical protein
VNQKGPVDHQLNYIIVKNASKRVLLLICGCHPVISQVPLESSDFVVGLREFAVSNGFTTASFLNGALGDVNP